MGAIVGMFCLQKDESSKSRAETNKETNIGKQQTTKSCTEDWQVKCNLSEHASMRYGFIAIVTLVLPDTLSQH
jgi:hypothetical protein